MRKLKKRIVDYTTRIDSLIENKKRNEDQEDELVYTHYRIL